MALVTPIINSIPALDATQANTITFIANGGEPIVKNEIKVLTNDGEETVVYSHVETTTAQGQIIPAHTLDNGVYYKVLFRTYDASDNTSEWSNYQPFYCFSTPTLTFNVSDGQIIHDSSLNLTLTYNQAENERLGNAIIYFYDINGRLISNSGYLFNSNVPPIVFNYPLSNLENNKGYKIKADAVTVNNNVLTTGLITFYVSYEIVDTEGKVYPEIDSCEGRIHAVSSPIVRATTGQNEHNPNVLSYIDYDTKLDLTSVVGEVNVDNPYSYWVRWYDLYPVSSFFLFRLWFYPARTSFHVAKIISDTNVINIYYRRGVTEDYISIRSSNGVKIDRSIGMICNGRTKVFLWLRVKGETWDIQTEVLFNPYTILYWNYNSYNNMRYNTTTSIPYGDEFSGTFEPVSDEIYPLTDTFTSVMVGNGVFDEMILSLDVDMPYSSEMPDEDISSILLVKFNGSVTNEAPIDHNYNKVMLQRKDDTMLTWWTMKILEIPLASTFAQLVFDDYFIPSGIKQSYALTLYENDVPSRTYTVDVVPKWGRVFLTDKDENYKLNYAVIYSNGSQNIQNGALMPIGAKYPIVIQNAEGNYKSGSLQFKVLGYQFEIDRTLDRNSIVKQKEDILAFLTNGKPKCIKDYNGNIVICKVINSPQVSYDANWGNGIVTISFDWVEQGKYNDYDDMTELGLIEAVTDS